jgi:hypothetical protein
MTSPIPSAFVAPHEPKPLPCVDPFFRNIHWEAVAARLEKALHARAAWTAGEVR